MEAIAQCMGGKGNVAIMLGELASNATAERTAAFQTPVSPSRSAA